MTVFKKSIAGFLLLVSILFGSNAIANDVEVVNAQFKRDTNDTWTISVTLLHKDRGWDHYADKWRIVDSDQNVITERVLLHPHDNEQPFERSRNDVRIPAGVSILFVEAHDKVHGWNEKKLEIDLSKVNKAGHLMVSAD